ncbi:MAG: hypothetical protein M0030_14515 [Actinomycetota bacterium]|nr:hypothetical protein [Actinomycetota bacterium]
MTLLIATWTLTAVLAAAGITWTVRLVRSGGRSWHPGDPLPPVPADAPLRTWHDTARRTRVTETSPAPERRTSEPRTRVADSVPSAR